MFLGFSLNMFRGLSLFALEFFLSDGSIEG